MRGKEAKRLRKMLTYFGVSRTRPPMEPVPGTERFTFIVDFESPEVSKVIRTSTASPAIKGAKSRRMVGASSTLAYPARSWRPIYKRMKREASDGR